MSNEANIELQALVRELNALWSGKPSAITCAEDAYEQCRRIADLAEQEG